MFPQTRLSVVERLGSTDATERQLAWDALVAAYWRPVYRYLRARWRLTPEAAEDLTQDFFARAIAKGFLESYDPARARFRTWLRTGVDGVASHAHEAAGRLKRGGGVITVPLDFTTAEGEICEVPLEADVDLDAWFHHEFVRSLFTRAVDALRADYEARGHGSHLELFEAYDLSDLRDDDRPSYKALAEARGWAVHDVTNRLAATRRDFRAHVLRLLRESCASDEEYQREARHLFGTRESG
jgi:DNA-directed RNA polymerase specialized sigma24 family protein